MTYMTKDQIRQHLLNAPPGTTPGGVIQALRDNGVQMEGDPMASGKGAFESIKDAGMGYLERIGGRVTQAKDNIVSSLDDYNAGKQGFVDTTLQTAGNIFSGVLSPATEASSTIVGGALNATGLDKPLAAGVQAVAASPVGQAASGIYQKAKQAAPQQLKTFESVGKAVIDAADVYGSAAAIEGTAKVAKAGFGELKDSLKAGLKESFPGKDFDTVVAEGVAKGIKPQFRGAMKSSAASLPEYNQKASQAVKEILDNTDSLQYLDDAGEVVSQGHSPTNLSEFAQAISQRKKQIYEQYSALTKQATGQGNKIDLSEIADKLLDYADDPVKQLSDPRKTDYAIRMAENLYKKRNLDPTQVENLVKELNQSLAPSYADKAAKGVSEVDLSIANALREKLDDAVFQATGQEYQPLKNAYGALKTVEKDVGHRALIAARQNAKGLPDMTDIFTGGDVVAGIVSGNPAFLLRGAAGWGIKNWYKSINSPDKNIMRMFSRGGKALSKQARSGADNFPGLTAAEVSALTPEERATGLLGGGGDDMPRLPSKEAPGGFSQPQPGVMADSKTTSGISQGAKPGTRLYHGTDKTFNDFDTSKSADGSIWFTDNKADITDPARGVAATGKGVIVERVLPENLKLATPEMLDSKFSDQLIAEGYDGVYYPGDESTGGFYQIFNPNKLTN